VLFVGHGAERTGPPIGLLHLLRWIRAHTDLDFEVLLLEGGDLLPEYEALAPVTVLHESRQPRLAVLGRTAAERAGTEGLGERLRVAAYRRRLRHLTGFRTVYVNSAWCIRALPYLPDDDHQVVAAVHELSVGLDYHLDERHRRLLLERPDHYLVVSGAVWRNMVEHHGIDPAKVSLHHEMIEVVAEPATPSGHEGPAVVGASGLLRWRKGPDLFLAVAARVHRLRPDLDVRWRWIGGLADDPDPKAVRHDRDAAGLTDVVELVGHVSDPIAHYRALDVLLLTSREDAYPLVCLEAASVGVPVVTFVNGGMPEMVDGRVDALGDPRDPPPEVTGDPAGFVVDYPDVAAMAEHVVELLDDAALRRRLGATGAARVRRWHAVEVAAPRLVEDLAPWLGAHRTDLTDLTDRTDLAGGSR
jgi:glycosyltransferase involved in cell wall biosynthesis